MSVTWITSTNAPIRADNDWATCRCASSGLWDSFALFVRIQAGSQDDLPAYLSLHHRALVLSKGDMVQPPTICSAVDGAKALRWGD